MSDRDTRQRPSGAPEDALIGSILKEKYQVTARLGVGNTGIVYVAETLRGGRQRAVKVYLREYTSSPPLRERFEKAARSLKSLSHLNIAAIKDFGIDRECAFVVTELLKGNTLREQLGTGSISPKGLFSITEQLLKALVFAHGQGFVHGDLKPHNIALEPLPDGSLQVRLRDLGVSQFVTSDEPQAGSPPLTMTGKPFGNAVYMAPEQSQGGTPFDARSDLYSAAVIFFEMLTGHPPFDGEGGELVEQHLSAARPRLRERRPELTAAPELDAFVQHSMAKDPENRFQDALEMLKALESLKKPIERALPSARRPSLTPAPVRGSEPSIPPLPQGETKLTPPPPPPPHSAGTRGQAPPLPKQVAPSRPPPPPKPSAPPEPPSPSKPPKPLASAERRVPSKPPRPPVPADPRLPSKPPEALEKKAHSKPATPPESSSRSKSEPVSKEKQTLDIKRPSRAASHRKKKRPSLWIGLIAFLSTCVLAGVPTILYFKLYRGDPPNDDITSDNGGPEDPTDVVAASDLVPMPGSQQGDSGSTDGDTSSDGHMKTPDVVLGSGDDENRVMPLEDVVVEVGDAPGGESEQSDEEPDIETLIKTASTNLDVGQGLGEEVVKGLRAYAVKTKEDARPLLILARYRVSRGHYTDGLDRYELAYEVDPEARRDRLMLNDLVKLSKSRTVGQRAARMVKRIYGREAIESVSRALNDQGLEQIEAKNLGRLLKTLQRLEE